MNYTSTYAVIHAQKGLYIHFDAPKLIAFNFARVRKSS